MPNFDGNGPLKRGRVIGRGRGPCGKGRQEQEEERPGGLTENRKARNAT